MSKLKRVPAAFSRLLTGVPDLTPAQQARLDELDRDYADWIRRKQEDSPDRVRCNEPSPRQSSTEERTV